MGYRRGGGRLVTSGVGAFGQKRPQKTRVGLGSSPPRLLWPLESGGGVGGENIH